MSEYLVETKALTKKFGEHKALDSVNIHVKKGAIYGLIGRNGAGKTTFMKIITGLANQTSGDYLLDGKNSVELRKEGIRVGCHIEDPGLYPDMTAFQNLKMKCIQLGINDDGHIRKLLEFVGLGNTGKKGAAKFSLGMKQRLGIAMAMVGDPELLVLDEPINGLDPQGIREIRELLFKLHEEGKTIIVSSHILDELSRIATDFGIIHKGRLIEEVSEEELRAECMDKVIVRTAETDKALTILREMKIDELTGQEDMIEINGHISETGKINSELMKAGIVADEIYVRSESLEEHYFKLTAE